MIGKEILNYEITSFIGKGGMGSVYIAQNKYIKTQKVAVKVINNDMVNSFTKAKLVEEAVHLSNLKHPNIVGLLNYEVSEDGSLYLLMEYVDGLSLEDYINNVSGLIVEEKIGALFGPILDAVGYAHKHNIIHRDLKPNNIMVPKEGTPKVLDFGIARIMKNEDGSDASDGMIMGTPSYMSPEQVKGEALDARSDIYSLGVVLHQMLVGKAPYNVTELSEHEINLKVINEPLPRMKSFYPYISDKVQKIVDKATAKKPSDRYQTCEEFKKALMAAVNPTKVPIWGKYATAAAAVLVVGTGIYWWDYTRVKTYFYKDFVEQFGIPQGIYELSSSESSHLSRMYRFEYCRRKLIHVSHVNSFGTIIEDNESERGDRPDDMYFSYNANGSLAKVKVFGTTGNCLYVKSYNENATTLTFQYDDLHGTERCLNLNTVGSSGVVATGMDKSNITRWLIEYDSKGYVKGIQYAGFQNMLVGDDDNIYGRQYNRDSKGRIIEEIYLGKDGKPKATKYGLGKKIFSYDNADNLVQVLYQTSDGKPSFDSAGGLQIYQMQYDKYGNVILELHCDAEGNPMTTEVYVTCGYKHDYDEHGLEVKRTIIDRNQEPCYSTSGYSSTRLEYDQNGRLVKMTYLDIDGNPCISSYGNSYFTKNYDEKGNCSAFWNYDITNQKVETTDGYSGCVREFDSNSRITKIVYYGADESVSIQKDGTVGKLYTYNDLGLMLTCTNLVKENIPGKDNSGVIIYNYEYDAKGNLTKVSYTEHNGKTLSNSNDGFAIIERGYDEKGHILSEKYFDTNKVNVMSSKGYAAIKRTLDEFGNPKSLLYYDNNGNLCLVNGTAGTKYVCDERGNLIEEYEVGKDGELASGYLIIKSEYDHNDNKTEWALFDKNYNKAFSKYGYHRYVSTFDSRNKETERKYLGKNGELVLCSDGYAIVRYQYDERGNGTLISYFGKDSRPIMSTDGYASVRYEYNEYNLISKIMRFGTDGKPTKVSDIIPVVIFKYDQWGNRTYYGYEDGNGNKTTDPTDGYSIYRKEFNIRGSEISNAYYDVNDKPILLKTYGFHARRMTYDNQGNMLTEAFFNESNNAIEPKKIGYHMSKYEYDKQNRVTTTTYFNKSGILTEVEGNAKITCTYNKRGNIQTRSYFDKSLNLRKDWAREEYTYTEDGENKKCIVYNASGNVYRKYNWNSRKEEWEEEQNWTTFIHQLNDGSPFELSNEFAGLTMTSARVNGAKSCSIYLQAPLTKYQISNSQLTTYQNACRSLAENLQSDDAFRGISISITLYDKINTYLYSNTY